MNLKEVRDTINEVINEVCDHHNSTVLHKGEKAIAALIDIALFEQLSMSKLNFNELNIKIGQVYQDVSTAEAEADIQEALNSLKENK